MSKRRAVVTGATSGIGEALVYLLCERNWAVIGVGRNQENLAEKAQSLTHFMGIAADVTDESSVSNLATEIERLKITHGQITALFQCAGAIPGNRLFHPIEETSSVFFEDVWRVNLLSKFLVARALLPYIAPPSPPTRSFPMRLLITQRCGE